MTAPQSPDPAAVSSSSPALERIPLFVWGRCAILVVGGFLSMLSATVVNVALPAMASAFDVPLANMQWVATAFLLGLGAAIPVSGWVAQRFGMTRLWLTMLALFTVLSVACALAPDFYVLVGLRLALGLAGGVLVPLSQMMLGSIAGPRRMGRVMSVLGVPILLAPALGVTVGSLLLTHLGWTALFCINLPIGLLGLAAGWAFLPRIEGGNAGRLDGFGLACLAFGLPAIAWGVSSIVAGAVSNSPSLWILAAGALLLLVFAVHAWRAERPILKIRFLSRPTFALAGLIVFSSGFVTFGA